jgi:hypothetical protein
MVGVFYFPEHLDPLVNVVWQKLRITFPAGSCTVDPPMLFGKNNV